MNYVGSLLIILSFALLINFSVSQSTESSEENEKTEADVFIPTHEWQIVKEGKK